MSTRGYDFYYDPAYASLTDVLARAHQQAATGKGAERHASNRPFTEQPMQAISGLLGSSTGLLYQAIKKIQESQRLPHDAAVRELLGAINYIAGDIIFKEGKQPLLKLEGVSAPVSSANTATSYAKTDHATHWTCCHALVEPANAKKVPVGEACPVCFASQ